MHRNRIKSILFRRPLTTVTAVLLRHSKIHRLQQLFKTIAKNLLLIRFMPPEHDLVRLSVQESDAVEIAHAIPGKRQQYALRHILMHQNRRGIQIQPI